MPEPLSFHAAMLAAVSLAEQGRFRTRPNPCVGAVLLKDGQIVASGWHKGPGLPHAEVEALRDAKEKGVDPAACVMVVTLEPCRHTGKTPPCTEAILASGIKRLVVGSLDPNPQASGGAELLRSQGLEVQTGVAPQECADLLDDFLTWQTTPLPYTLLKLASSLDGRIATRSGHSQWISSEQSRGQVHVLRSQVQAVIVGGNTFYADNPRLTCRLGASALPASEPGNPVASGIPATSGVENASGTEGAPCTQPLAVVVTSRLPDATADLHLLRERAESLIFWTTAASAASPRASALRGIGVRVLGLEGQLRSSSSPLNFHAKLNLAQGLADLRQNHNCHYALCEGGGKLGLALLEDGLARELHLHLAPTIFADNEARPLFDGRSPRSVEEALALRLCASKCCGKDIHLTFRPSFAPRCTPEADKAEAPGRLG